MHGGAADHKQLRVEEFMPGDLAQYIAGDGLEPADPQRAPDPDERFELLLHVGCGLVDLGPAQVEVDLLLLGLRRPPAERAHLLFAGERVGEIGREVFVGADLLPAHGATELFLPRQKKLAAFPHLASIFEMPELGSVHGNGFEV